MNLFEFEIFIYIISIDRNLIELMIKGRDERIPRIYLAETWNLRIFSLHLAPPHPSLSATRV